MSLDIIAYQIPALQRGYCSIAPNCLQPAQVIQAWKPNENNDLVFHSDGWIVCLPPKTPPPLPSTDVHLYKCPPFFICFPLSICPYLIFRHQLISLSFFVLLSLRCIPLGSAQHPKYNYSPQLNGEEGSSGILRNRKWSGGLG